MTLKERLRRGDLTLGSWITIGHPAIAELMVDAGFDWLAIDMEHSVISLREAQELIRAIEMGGATPLVRLTSNHADQVKRLLDAGAQGVIVPMVNSAADARAAVDHAHYPPAGTRSVGLARAQGYGATFESYFAERAPSTVVVIQVEHHRAVAALPEILGEVGIDATLIGPYDLSASLGRPGRFDDPEVVRHIAEYERVSRAAGVPMGYHAVDTNPAAVEAKAMAGYQFVAYGADFLFLRDAARRGMQALRQALSSFGPS
jgi:2-dehydro-3-deoxyglucarate aldolase